MIFKIIETNKRDDGVVLYRVKKGKRIVHNGLDYRQAMLTIESMASSNDTIKEVNK